MRCGTPVSMEFAPTALSASSNNEPQLFSNGTGQALIRRGKTGAAGRSPVHLLPFSYRFASLSYHPDMGR